MSGLVSVFLYRLVGICEDRCLFNKVDVCSIIIFDFGSGYSCWVDLGFVCV